MAELARTWPNERSQSRGQYSAALLRKALKAPGAGRGNYVAEALRY